MADLTAALEKAGQANAEFAAANQKLELEKARLEQQVAQNNDGESAKLIGQLRDQAAGSPNRSRPSRRTRPPPSAIQP